MPHQTAVCVLFLLKLKWPKNKSFCYFSFSLSPNFYADRKSFSHHVFFSLGNFAERGILGCHNIPLLLLCRQFPWWLQVLSPDVLYLWRIHWETEAQFLGFCSMLSLLIGHEFFSWQWLLSRKVLLPNYSYSRSGSDTLLPVSCTVIIPSGTVSSHSRQTAVCYCICVVTDSIIRA